MRKNIPKVNCVSFLITREDSILVEKRDLKKRIDPGIISFPGGHVSHGESLEEACRRELLEELGLTCESYRLFKAVKHRTPLEIQMVYYYLCENLSGELVSNEATDIFWLSKNEASRLYYDFERNIVNILFK
jgi:mutator protein MutT